MKVGKANLYLQASEIFLELICLDAGINQYHVQFCERYWEQFPLQCLLPSAALNKDTLEHLHPIEAQLLQDQLNQGSSDP